MNLSWLITFKEVADTGSYTRASEALFLSQPAVSQQVRQLERYFGAQLIRRVGQDLQLTEAGKQIYELAARIETDFGATRQNLRDLISTTHHTVTIASAPTPLLHIVPLALNRFWLKHPDVAVKTIVRFGPGITEAVRLGEADLGIHSESYMDRSLDATRLGEGHIVAVCSPKHPLAGVKGIVQSDVASQRVVITGPNTGTRRSVEAWFDREGLSLRNVMEVSAHEEIRIAALQNLGIGFLGLSTASSDVAAGRLVLLDLEAFDIARPGFVSYKKGLTEPASWLVAALVREHAAQAAPAHL